MKLSGEARFNKARQQLSAALKNLEEAVKDKINETSLSTEFLTNDESNLVEQAAAVSRISTEVNRLQNELSELGKETEFLRETNHVLGQRIEIFRQQKNDLVEAIEDDLTAITEVIEKYDG